MRRRPTGANVSARSSSFSPVACSRILTPHIEPKQSKAKPKEKEKKETVRQTTLFGLPPAQPAEKKAAGRKKKAGTPAGEESQDTAVRAESQTDTQTDVPMEESQEAETEGGGDTQVDAPSQVPTEVESQGQGTDAMDAEVCCVLRQSRLVRGELTLCPAGPWNSD